MEKPFVISRQQICRLVLEPLDLAGAHTHSRPVACAADHAVTTPCCGQLADRDASGIPGNVTREYRCTKQEPKCINYVKDVKWGTCTNPARAEPGTYAAALDGFCRCA